jgi:hypothetical protein
MAIECSPRPFPENSRRWKRGLLARANERDNRSGIFTLMQRYARLWLRKSTAPMESLSCVRDPGDQLVLRARCGQPGQTIPTAVSPQKQMLLRVPTHDNAAMSDPALPVALCCFKNRAIVVNRCDLCKGEYACPEFKSKAAVMKFNALIPPSMLLAPLPIELWPSMCSNVAPGLSSKSTHSASNGSTESPVRRFVSTLIDGDPQAI